MLGTVGVLSLTLLIVQVWHIGILAALSRLYDKDSGSMSEDTAYTVLDIPSNITSKDLKKHFRNISLILHPDKHPDDEAANEKYMRLRLAYEVNNQISKFDL